MTAVRSYTTQSVVVNAMFPGAGATPGTYEGYAEALTYNLCWIWGFLVKSILNWCGNHPQKAQQHQSPDLGERLSKLL